MHRDAQGERAPPAAGASRTPGPRRNAPSRCRLRPTIRPTAAEAIAARRAINLGRSVLGARTTLGCPAVPVKGAPEEDVAICDLFISHSIELRVAPHALGRRTLERASPSPHGRRRGSPSRERFRPPPRRTVRFRVAPLGRVSTYRRPVLGAGGRLRHHGRVLQGDRGANVAEFASFSASWPRATAPAVAVAAVRRGHDWITEVR